MKSFIDHLVENRSVDVMMTRMANELEIVDKDFGNVFIVRDKKMQELTNEEHMFDVRFHGHGDIEVHPHNEKDHDRAAEIERKLTEGAPTLTEASEEKRAAILKGIKDRENVSTAKDRAHKATVAARMEKKYGKNWRTKAAQAEKTRQEASNKKVKDHNEATGQG